MVSRLSKLPWIVASAVFIFLSVCGAERTRCFWCGPLAEQVHRSQRAPSCDNFHLEQHETFCDQGYTHCAIVAVSPPYAESRLCVKFYQDECYSLYCNSTKTWRMVCACRGDLCNGPRSARETQAFALLPKFIKAKPHKRNLVSHFISLKTKPTNDDTIIILSKENETINNIQSDQPTENINLYTPTPKHVEDNTIIVHGTLKNVEKSKIHASPNKAETNDESKMYGEEHTMPVIDTNLDNTEQHETNNNADTQINTAEVTKLPNNAETDKNAIDSNSENPSNIDEGKTIDNAEGAKNIDQAEIDKEVNKSEANKLDNTEMSKRTETAQITKENQDLAAAEVTSMKPTVEVAVAVLSSVTPGNLPAAEALQQNVTPTMEQTTIEAIAMSTANHAIETTLSVEVNNTKKKNGATKNFAHYIMFVIYFLVHNCI